MRNQPDREIFFSKEGTQWKGVTWKQYYETVKQLSLGLLELGVQPGENVNLISNTRLEWSAADMAILGARAVTVPVYASNTPDETQYIIDHCEAKIVFVEDNKQLEKVLSVRDRLPRVKKIIVFNMVGSPQLANEKDVLSLSALRELGKRASSPERFEQNLLAVKPTDIFTVCYTSGTTGVPKGVVLTHDALMSELEDVDKMIAGQNNALEVGEGDRVLSFLPVSHIFGKIESMAVYQFGWEVYYAESIEKLLMNMAEVSPTMLFAVPRVFEKAYNRIKASIDESSPSKRKLFDWALGAGRAYYGKVWAGKKPSLLENAQYQLARKLVFSKVYAKFGGRVRFCVAGGAPLPREIGEFMRIVGLTILEGYGLTETCAAVTVNTLDNIKYGSIGKPLPEAAIKIADDGEILVKSRKVFREYYKNPEATREVLSTDGWFHTGDIGVIDDEGFVKITDRKKDLIVTSGGKNVAPQKIENLAKTHKYVSQFMVHGDKRNYLTALVVLEKEDVVKFAKEQNILFSEYTELVKNPKVQGLVQKIVDEVNGKLASFETIKRFKILPNEFTIESGELTPSLKIRRRYCNDKYRSELDSMYGASAPN
ncbi:MAG: long-chain fatty acid--CoA ligase [Deltaproteobacteria bacterium]|nr:long-chain fatty acid--CoA ligase [Deltaproteobacteria bacterium]